MEIQDLNNIANDIAVLRLHIKYAQEDLEAHLKQDQKVQELQNLISEYNLTKDQLQHQLMISMKEEGLKSWKTEKANFSLSTRYSVEIDPEYKKQVQARLKDGEEIQNFQLKETEFISIRSVN